jgi:hypothetical protein
LAGGADLEKRDKIRIVGAMGTLAGDAGVFLA